MGLCFVTRSWCTCIHGSWAAGSGWLGLGGEGSCRHVCFLEPGTRRPPGHAPAGVKWEPKRVSVRLRCEPTHGSSPAEQPHRGPSRRGRGKVYIHRLLRRLTDVWSPGPFRICVAQPVPPSTQRVASVSHPTFCLCRTHSPTGGKGAGWALRERRAFISDDAHAWSPAPSPQRALLCFLRHGTDTSPDASPAKTTHWLGQLLC